MAENCDNENESFDGFDIKRIKRDFKALAAELVTEDAITIKTEKEPTFRNYSPTILDFLARAKTIEECNEIIDFCHSQNEITKEEAEKYRKVLESSGPDVFGDRKPGFYDETS
jgi:hypothetical protein